MRADYTDDVRGFVIGDVTVPYEFWIRDEFPPGYYGKRCLTRGHFANDTEAVAWFRDNYPNEFAAGAEMRVFDR